jgi:arylsulfatase
MHKWLLIRAALMGLFVVAALGGTVFAQQITGTPGSADMTTTNGSQVLPPPSFAAQIELNAAQSKPGWPARAVPPKSARNIPATTA